MCGGTLSVLADVPVATSSVTIGGDAPHPGNVPAADIAAATHLHLDVVDEDKQNAAYDGVPLYVLLEHAGITFGQAMHGSRLMDYVVVTGADGYHAMFALAELDPAFRDRRVVLADRRNGMPLDAKHGPLQIIAPDEHRHARWVRNVTSIVLEHAPAPQP